MKALVVYFSRTGNTKKVAQKIKQNLKCDIEEITDAVKRQGTMGYMKCGAHSSLKMRTRINATDKDPSRYDLIIIGTPVWAFNMSSPVRTYIIKNRDKFNKVAFFCTLGGKGSRKTLHDMEMKCNKEPEANLAVYEREIKENRFADKVKKFCKMLK
ncbi:hypothetical protein GF371_00695 [Candidatus Woesearchaeota archaeon]|nr:hypothetical protein [Candidatus Woesearchaeota archaeon]